MIKLPDGHPENLDRDHSFVEWTKDASLQQPAPLARSEAGARMDAAVKLMELRLSEYLTALVANAGEENIERRLKLNVEASLRRNAPRLAAVLGLK